MFDVVVFEGPDMLAEFRDHRQPKLASLPTAVENLNAL